MSTSHNETALIPYLRGELSAEQRASVARHLEGCAACREAADSLADTIGELAHRLEEVPAPDLATYRAELHRRLAAAPSPRARAERHGLRPWVSGVSLAVVGAAAAALILILLMPHGGRIEPPPLEQLATQDAAVQEAVTSGVEVGLLRAYPVVARLDLLENYDVIAHLDEVLAPDAARR